MTGLRFTETMTGFVAVGATDFDEGHAAGQREGVECTFTVTIRIPDVEQHLADNDAWAVVEGHVYCPSFGGRRKVTDGRFKLFDAHDEKAPIMRYRLPFFGTDGCEYELVGSKHLGAGRNPWKDTTRLKTQIRRGHLTGVLEDTGAETVASGLVHITPSAFARQLTTMRTGFAAGGRFAVGFARTIYDVYRPDPGVDVAGAA